VSQAVSDPIVDEVRAIRDAYAESLGYDPSAIVADLCSRQGQHLNRLVSLPPRPGRQVRLHRFGARRRREMPLAPLRA